MSRSSATSKLVPAKIPRCPTCDTAMEFVAITPTCQSVIYEYICPNEGDRLNWECRQHAAPRGDARQRA